MKKIKFYPFNEQIVDLVPKPSPTFKHVPDWYKHQPGSVNEEQAFANGAGGATIKKCMPVFDMMTAGYVLGFPCDIFIDATDPNKLKWSTPQPMRQVIPDVVSHHSFEQYSHYPIDQTQYHKELFRILPYWSVGTPKGYSAMFMHPIHRDELPFWSFGGFVDTDGFISDGHFSMLIKKDFKGVIKQGTPFIQIIPIQRESWEMELVDASEASKILQKQRVNVRANFVNAYKNKFRSKKEFK